MIEDTRDSWNKDKSRDRDQNRNRDRDRDRQLTLTISSWTPTPIDIITTLQLIRSTITPMGTTNKPKLNYLNNYGRNVIKKSGGWMTCSKVWIIKLRMFEGIVLAVLLCYCVIFFKLYYVLFYIFSRFVNKIYNNQK